VKYGDRVAQLIIEKYTITDLEEVEELDSTERGAGGFGSTGVSLTQKLVLAEDGKSSSKKIVS
jgi:hypothetical protein